MSSLCFSSASTVAVSEGTRQTRPHTQVLSRAGVSAFLPAQGVVSPGRVFRSLSLSAYRQRLVGRPLRCSSRPLSARFTSRSFVFSALSNVRQGRSSVRSCPESSTAAALQVAQRIQNPGAPQVLFKPRPRQCDTSRRAFVRYGDSHADGSLIDFLFLLSALLQCAFLLRRPLFLLQLWKLVISCGVETGCCHAPSWVTTRTLRAVSPQCTRMAEEIVEQITDATVPTIQGHTVHEVHRNQDIGQFWCIHRHLPLQT